MFPQKGFVSTERTLTHARDEIMLANDDIMWMWVSMISVRLCHNYRLSLYLVYEPNPCLQQDSRRRSSRSSSRSSSTSWIPTPCIPAQCRVNYALLVEYKNEFPAKLACFLVCIFLLHHLTPIRAHYPKTYICKCIWTDIVYSSDMITHPFIHWVNRIIPLYGLKVRVSGSTQNC